MIIQVHEVFYMKVVAIEDFKLRIGTHTHEIIKGESYEFTDAEWARIPHNYFESKESKKKKIEVD